MNELYNQKYIEYKNKYIQQKQLTYIENSNLEGGTKKTNFKPNGALEYSNWMKYAERHKLFFGPKDYAKLETDKKYNITQIDYILFLYIEYAKNHNIKSNKIYDPMDFFNRFKSEIVTQNKFKKGKCCNYYDVIINTKNDRSFSSGKKKSKNDKEMDFSFNCGDQVMVIPDGCCGKISQKCQNFTSRKKNISRLINI